MIGLHILAELKGCACEAAVLTDAARLRSIASDAVKAANLQEVGQAFHTFGGAGGVTGTILLAESHLALHTWPELGVVTLDAYVCNMTTDNSAKAHQLVDALVKAFMPLDTAKQLIHRGALG